jgi:hypothetical protein
LLAGVRSGALNVWQVIYEAEGLTVDLRFGRRAHQTAVHLVGQVLDKHVGRAWRNATIELSTEQEQLIATTAVNASGEFQVEFEGKRPSLVVGQDGRWQHGPDSADQPER